MTDREILESEKPFDLVALGNVGEDLTGLIKARDYQQVISKCHNIVSSK